MCVCECERENVCVCAREAESERDRSSEIVNARRRVNKYTSYELQMLNNFAHFHIKGILEPSEPYGNVARLEASKNKAHTHTHTHTHTHKPTKTQGKTTLEAKKDTRL